MLPRLQKGSMLDILKSSNSAALLVLNLLKSILSKRLIKIYQDDQPKKIAAFAALLCGLLIVDVDFVIRHAAHATPTRFSMILY